MTPASLQQTRPRQALLVLGGSTLVGVVLSCLHAFFLGWDGGRSEAVAAAVVLFVAAQSCFAFGVLAGLLTHRLAPMLMGYLPGLTVVLLTGLAIADIPQRGAVVLAEVLAAAWVLVNPLLWLPLAAVAVAALNLRRRPPPPPARRP